MIKKKEENELFERGCCCMPTIRMLVRRVGSRLALQLHADMKSHILLYIISTCTYSAEITGTLGSKVKTMEGTDGF